MAAEPSPCTQEIVSGTYALAYDGHVLSTTGNSDETVSLPIAGLALAAIDPEGAMSSTGYEGVGGTPRRISMLGRIRVNADCTGTVGWGDRLTANIVVLNEGAEIRSMMTSSVEPPVVSGHWKRISRTFNSIEGELCSPKDLVGWYVNELRGFVMTPVPGSSPPQVSAVPVAVLTVGRSANGVFSAHGQGTFGGEPVFVVVGSRVTAYPDCTFIVGHSNAPPDVWGVVLNGGKELWGIGLTHSRGYPVSSGTWWRIKKDDP